MAYSILSLDGGGTWSLIQVKILQERYGNQAKGHDILKQYDMVIANSGGSIILAGLCVNQTLEEIKAIFFKPAILDTIFVRKPISEIDPLNKYFPRFKTVDKIKGLRAQLGTDCDILLNEIPGFVGKESLQIIITSYDYDT